MHDEMNGKDGKEDALARAPSPSLALPSATIDVDVLGHYLASLRSPASRRTMLSILGRAARGLLALEGVAVEARACGADVARSYPWHAPGCLTFARLNAVVAAAATEPPTARLMLAALRGIARAAHHLRLLSSDERALIDDIRPPRLSGKKRGRRLTRREVARLFDACRKDSAPVGRRDAALFAVLLGGGLRRAEASALNLGDVAAAVHEGMNVTRITVRHGKGGKYEEVIAPPDVAAAVEDYQAVRGDAPGPLFWSAKGRSRPLDTGARLTTTGIYNILMRRAGQAEIARAAPHDLRRTAVTELIERTSDLALTQRFARHAQAQTTVGYDERDKRALERVQAVASSGYLGRERP